MVMDSLLLTGEAPSGAVAKFTVTQTDDTASRFTTTSRIYRNVFITVTDYAQYLGDSSDQYVPLYPFTPLVLDYFDLSTLYFKNLNAGDDGTIVALCVEL